MSAANLNAMKLALYYLGRRARTEQEMRDKLAAKEIPTEEIEAVIKKLKEYGYIDDQKFAQDFQRSRDDYRPTGVRRLKLELRQKGIDKEILEKVTVEPDREFQLAAAAAQSRLRQLSNLPAPDFNRRMMAFLTRRGFNYDVIKRVLTDLELGEKPNND